jgi:predicted O-methyltransferase YrrM
MADKDSRSGTRYADDEIIAYVDRIHAPHDAGLADAFAAPERDGLPAIQVAPSDGKLITLLLRLAGCKTVVEIGTLAGYSALRILDGLPADGHLYTIEIDPRHAEVARGVIARAGHAARATVLLGPALDHLPALGAKGPFDAVFIDADKASYDKYGAWAAANLRKGGLLLGDNAYLFGRLCDGGDEAAAMRRFHEAATKDFDTVCAPTPDGLLVGVRR